MFKVGAFAIITNENQEFLLGHRLDYDLWNLIGGGVEDDEAPWEQRRPGKVALNESIVLSNAVAKLVFVDAGITRLRWAAIGGESCPFCQEMDGKIVGVEQPFVAHDTVLQAEGKSDMKIYKPALHPPLHEGCVCQVEPE